MFRRLSLKFLNPYNLVSFSPSLIKLILACLYEKLEIRNDSARNSATTT